MDDRQIREFLVRLPSDAEIRPGFVVIRRDHVAEFGGDDHAVYQWVLDHAGEVRNHPKPQRAGTPVGPPEWDAYYEIPAEALTA